MGRTLPKSLPKGFATLVLLGLAGLAAAFDDLPSPVGADDLRGALLEEAAPATPAEPAPELFLCPRMRVANAPAADADRRVLNFAPTFQIDGQTLATNPASGACLSSAFGSRNGRVHRGVDYYAPGGVPIAAAGEGVVIERVYRSDYGNMLLIDHGNGVYTRYAHLARFDVELGAHVSAGQEIGMMGNTAGHRIPTHLHYEVLTGDYNTPRASFGLEAHSPFALAPQTS